jgi:hypothetical protein
MQDEQFIECVAERDIDLLLLEELHVSVAFRSWLLGQTFGQDVCCARFLGAWHSVSHPTLGESDLLLLFADTRGNSTALLIENKIDAPPQLEQAARYRLRGQAGLNHGSWTKFRTCIIAPQAYLGGIGDVGAYEVRLSYELIRDWFQQAGAKDERSTYKARIVQEAIEQNRRGYRPTPHAAVTQFWSDYWHLACAEFPQLQLKQPDQTPAESDWPQFRNSELGPGRRIVHKLADGVVDLEIGSAGAIVEQIAARNAEVVKGELEVVRTGKSASVRLRVPKVDRFGDLSSQLSAVRAGLSAASRLLALSSRIEAG